MATFLYRLGRAAYGRRRAVLLAWVLLLAVLGGLAAGFAKGTTTTLHDPRRRVGPGREPAPGAVPAPAAPEVPPPASCSRLPPASP